MIGKTFYTYQLTGIEIFPILSLLIYLPRRDDRESRWFSLGFRWLTRGFWIEVWSVKNV